MTSAVRAIAAALVATAALVSPAAAQQAPVHTTAGSFTDGPFGVRIVRPAVAPRCDARYLQVGVRFTRFSEAAHVHSVRTTLLRPDGSLRSGEGESFRASGGRLQLGKLHPRACGQAYQVRYRVNAGTGTRYRVRTFEVTIQS
jgi:hypothetical protein